MNAMSEPEQWIQHQAIKEDPTENSVYGPDIYESHEPIVLIKTEPEEDPFKDTHQKVEGIKSERPLQYELEIDVTPVKETGFQDNGYIKNNGKKIKSRDYSCNKNNGKKVKTINAQRKVQNRDDISSKSQNVNIQINLPNVRIVTITQDGKQETVNEPPPGLIVCETCMKVFKNKYNLIQHAIIHTGEKPFTCQVCQFKFVRKTHMQRHIKKIHPDFIPKEEAVTNKVKLKRRRHKPLTIKIYPCNSCDRVFKRQAHLLSHLLVHSGEKPYVCKICGKRFTEKGNMARHIQLHSGVKQFACDNCDKRFSSKNNLIKHIQVTSGVLRHSVNRKTCGNLKDLKNSSSKLRCDLCHTWYKDEQHLKAHLQFHSGVKTYSHKS